MKKDCYIYPAIFEYEKKGISISFPDLPGCISCAKDDEEALYMAKDALGLYIVCAEEDGEELPHPSKLNKINLTQNQKITLVEVNMPLFRDAVQNSAVKKTLTIPKWINELAEKNHINFSQVLQTSLKNILNLNVKK
ncbi:MAG: type II toxin-antitoxin system HicB family antitoxin [Clostridia bacterium]